MAARPSHKLVIAPEAETDLAEAYGWYESRRAGLGEDFLGCVDACVETLLRQPLACAKVHEDYRRAVVRRFPYVIFYESTDDVVIVYCIFHAARHPEKWRQRLP